MSSDTDTRRVSARLDEETYQDLEDAVDAGDIPSKSKAIRDGVRRELDRREDLESALERIEDAVEDLPDECRRVIRGEFSRVDSRDTSGRGR